MSKNCFEERHVDLLFIGEEKKNTMFLSEILINLCMVIHYIVEENIFAVIVCNLLAPKEY